MKKTMTFILIILAAVFVTMSVKRSRDKEEAAESYNELKAEMFTEASEEIPDTAVDVEEIEPEAIALSDDERAMVDGVKRLQKDNGDVQGYIMILDSDIEKDRLCNAAMKDEGVVLQYPVYQRKGNDQEALDYYLHHNGKGERESYPGCIFGDGAIDEEGNYLFDLDSDGNHVIAGHNMSVHRNKKENWMFGSLRYYEEPEYLEEHKNLVLVTDETVKYFTIVSYYQAEADDDFYNIHPETPEALSKFLSDKTGMEIETDDSVTLVACDDDTSNDAGRRYVIAISE
ncbi:class B sortase [Oribacterium sp. FC2011]|uniref:class B sortase n=1 Tax=Oribacterium sp. FC2011 TaxID=1408311 RepID=UPI0004E10C25|nr:class B sortase [Oribacterium sp. FC2011]